jgi:hypothetical protein
MRKTVLTILGFSVHISYTVYPGGHMEWALTKSTLAGENLTSLLLRIHYGAFIEATLREAWFAEEYEEGQIESAQLNLQYRDTGF